MRILHVIPYMHPSAGGPPVVVENFVRETKKLGHVSEIVSSALYCDGDEQTLRDRLNDLTPTSLYSAWSSLGLFDGATRRGIAAAVKNADIVHIHTLWNPINAVVRGQCARLRRPYVLMPHGMLDPYSLSVRRWRKALYLYVVERRNLLSAQRLIYTTNEEAALARRDKSPLAEGAVIPLGGDSPDISPEELKIRFLERFPNARDRQQLLFLGRLHVKKGLDRILNALPAVKEFFPDVLLTVVGDGEPEYVNAIRARVKADALDNNVLMTGRLDGIAKWEAYAAADLFLLPSRQENFALTVAEAMHTGTPVIITEKVNTAGYVKEAGAGMVLEEVGLEEQFQTKILDLLRDDKTRKLMGTRGRQYAKINLTWAGAAAKLLDCYREVLASWKAGITTAPESKLARPANE
jgi:glycosyltransferase involved in cell wall biosynthesis